MNPINKFLFFSLVCFLFGVVSFAQTKTDDSQNQVIAIRRIWMPFEKFDRKIGRSFKVYDKSVEVEIVSDFKVEILNCCEPFAAIDGKNFYLIRGNANHYFIRMDEKKYNEIKDNSKICVGMSAINNEGWFVKFCENKTSSDKNKRIFTLKKKSIKKLPIIKENIEKQNKRRHKQ